MAEEQVNSEETVPAPEGDDLIASLVADEGNEAETPAEETPVESAETPEVEAEAQPEADTAEQPAAEAVEAPAETPADPAPQPGTPNKAIQKVLQRESAIERKLDELLEKIGEQGRATPQQAAQVQALQQQHEEVKDEIAELANAAPDTVDGFEGTIKVAKRVVTHDQELKSQKARVEALEAELSRIREESTWTKVEARYPGVDVRNVWSEAMSKAQALGYDGEAARLRANEIFHETASAPVPKPETKAVTKTATTPPPKATTPPAKTTARPAPPVTPNGASVTPKSGVVRTVPVSEEARQETLLKGLVR